MLHRTLTIGLFLSTGAVAGTVHFETDAAATVVHRGVPIARAPGPGVLTLGEFPEGPAGLEIQRPRLAPLRATVQVPAKGELTVRLSNHNISTSSGSVHAVELPPPTLAFRTEPGETFAVIIDGMQTHSLAGELALDSLEPGRHTVEVRSTDLLTVWVRGTVDLLAGDAVVLGLSEGRMAVADGLHSAWIPAKGDSQ